ncbi:chemotaxis protein CheA [Paracoccaceae bacterium Fryx2]|nr:chemotaxis protein CheA [Paracoccaceae bacterium Fryx2]
MTSMTSIRDTFFEECEDLLAALADGLDHIAAGTADGDVVNAVFRAVHSIKGGAGAFGLSDLVGFAHRFETVLDAVRNDKLVVDGAVLHTLQRSADHLAELMEAARDDLPLSPEVTAGFLEQLDLCLGDDDPESDAFADFEFAPLALDFGPPEVGGVFDIDFAPGPGLYRNGHEPALLIAALADLGTLEVRLDASALPDWDVLDPGKPGLRWSMRLTTPESEAALREVFEFVEGLCELDIRPVEAAVEAALPEPGPVAPEAPPLPPVATPLPPPDAAEEARPARPDDAEARGPKPTLRVDLERVDRLINAVGELIINQAMIAQRTAELGLAAESDVVTHVEDYRLLARDIQEAVMAIRAQPVKLLFQRMSRIVREAADSTGKLARLVTVGENTEVDKTVVERLADPLTHMIRNAVDHGLESPETRVAAGKDPCGTIRLAAAHRSGSVILTLRDDGAGLNRPRIRQIAEQRGLVSPEAELSDTEVDALLFMPGFSTAQSVSNLSGRGVGLDVVRSAVTSLGGRVSIASTPGQGTEFTVSLPLTLAVMDGMVVSVAGQTMVVPLASILETIRPAAADLHPMGSGETLLLIRGRFIPTVDVARALGFARPETAATPLLLLIEGENASQCALFVDAVHDQRQVVIKGLDSNYGAVPGVSAATVLGDGQIALILDPDAIAAQRPPLNFSEGTHHAAR